MLVKTINSVSQLREEFINYDRDYYSYEGYEFIFNYYEDLVTNTELDVIAICGDFNELSFEEFINDYSLELEEEEDQEEVISEYIEYNGGSYQILDNTVIYTVF